MKYIEGNNIDMHTGLWIYATRKQAYSYACSCF